MNKDKIIKKYCLECGNELLQIGIGAEKVKEMWGGDTCYPHSAYNHDTGKRQLGIRWKCPRKRWYNFHTDYTKLISPKLLNN